MKKSWPVAVVIFFFILIFSNDPAEAFNDEATLYLAQAAQKVSAKPSDTAGDQSQEQASEDEKDDNDEEDEYADEGEAQLIPDPWIEMNRGLYTFNDRLYFWVLKPVSRGYGFIIPKELRQAIRNAFYNVRFPVRFINCLLQGKISKSGDEFGQFFINTTVGCLGLLNPAANYPRLQPSPEDLGQTFAVWGSAPAPISCCRFSDLPACGMASDAWATQSWIPSIGFLETTSGWQSAFEPARPSTTHRCGSGNTRP